MVRPIAWSWRLSRKGIDHRLLSSVSNLNVGKGKCGYDGASDEPFVVS